MSPEWKRMKDNGTYVIRCHDENPYSCVLTWKIKKKYGADRMAQWVKAPASKLDELSLILGPT